MTRSVASQLICAHSLVDVYDAIALYDEVILWGGGTKIMRSRAYSPVSTTLPIVFLSQVAELKRMRVAGNILEVGSSVDLQAFIAQAKEFLPIVILKALGTIADPVHRSRMLIGGTLIPMNPMSCFPVVLSLFNCEVLLRRIEAGQRATQKWVGIKDVFGPNRAEIIGSDGSSLVLAIRMQLPERTDDKVFASYQAHRDIISEPTRALHYAYFCEMSGNMFKNASFAIGLADKGLVSLDMISRVLEKLVFPVFQGVVKDISQLIYDQIITQFGPKEADRAQKTVVYFENTIEKINKTFW